MLKFVDAAASGQFHFYASQMKVPPETSPGDVSKSILACPAAFDKGRMSVSRLMDILVHPYFKLARYQHKKFGTQAQARPRISIAGQQTEEDPADYLYASWVRDNIRLLRDELRPAKRAELIDAAFAAGIPEVPTFGLGALRVEVIALI